MGAHLVQLAKLKGARVLAVTSDERKTATLESLGSSDVIPTGELDFSEIVLALTEDRGVNVAFDTVGSPLFPQTLRSVALTGRLILLGELRRANVNMALPEIIFRELQMLGSVGTTRRHVEEAAQLVAEGKIRSVVSHILPWNDASSFVGAVREPPWSPDSVGRVVLDFT